MADQHSLTWLPPRSCRTRSGEPYQPCMPRREKCRCGLRHVTGGYHAAG